METHNVNRTKEFIKRYAPVSSFVLLTIILMIVFRMNKSDINRLIEKGKNNLAAFYTQNLKPLFASTEISSEDIFNFALYQNLPIDKEKNKVLLVSNEESGSQVYEIKPARFNPETNNYQKLVNYLGLNDVEKAKLDSILNSYKKEICLSVFTNDKNTVAISPKLGDVQKAVLADIVAFTQKIDFEKSDKLFTGKFSSEEGNQLAGLIHSTKEIEIPQSEYIFITPDTVFKSWVKVDEKKIEDEIKKAEQQKYWSKENFNNIKVDVEFNKELQKGLKAADKIVSMVSDSNFYKVIIPPVPELIPHAMNDSIKIKLDDVAKNLKKFSVNSGQWNQKRNRNKKNITDAPQRPIEPVHFEFNFAEPAAQIAEQVSKAVAKQDFKNWEEFGNKMDSLANVFSKTVEDSIAKMSKAKTELYKKRSSQKSKTKVNAEDSANIK
ncbi:MAG: hypothetical protein HYS25_16800 [Ignavibacteriales bacterium]|nr:hypothetical protein [Ignavibacteriales bacterium]